MISEKDSLLYVEKLESVGFDLEHWEYLRTKAQFEQLSRDETTDLLFYEKMITVAHKQINPEQ